MMANTIFTTDDLLVGAAEKKECTPIKGTSSTIPVERFAKVSMRATSFTMVRARHDLQKKPMFSLLLFATQRACSSPASTTTKVFPCGART